MGRSAAGPHHALETAGGVRVSRKRLRLPMRLPLSPRTAAAAAPAAPVRSACRRRPCPAADQSTRSRREGTTAVTVGPGAGAHEAAGRHACAPTADTCAPTADTCAPTADTCAPTADTCAPTADTCAPTALTSAWNCALRPATCSLRSRPATTRRASCRGGAAGREGAAVCGQPQGTPGPFPKCSCRVATVCDASAAASATDALPS